MKQHLEELLEMLTDPAMVIRFHALSQSKDQTSKAVPWRLQINMRTNRPYELLHYLTHNAIWMTVGASMKQHNQQQTPLATALQTMMGPPKPKGRGKGLKGLKGTPAKQES